MSDKRHDPPKENQVPTPIGTAFLVKIQMHTTEAYLTLDSPQLVRDAIGDALERWRLQEEVDFTLEVSRCYE